MLLTPTWKKIVIPKIVEKIFLNYNENIYLDKLRNLINAISRYEKLHAYSAIKYKNQTYIGFQASKLNPFKIFDLNKNHPYFKDFIAILEEKESYEKLTAEVVHYLSMGMAISHTTECLCAVFPESILNIITSIINIKVLKPIKPVAAKHINFVSKNETTVLAIEMQLVTNIIAPDIQNDAN